jgi:hypothetical protein
MIDKSHTEITSLSGVQPSRINPYPRVLMMCNPDLLLYGIIASAGIFFRGVVQAWNAEPDRSTARTSPARTTSERTASTRVPNAAVARPATMHYILELQQLDSSDTRQSNSLPSQEFLPRRRLLHGRS